MEVRKKIYTYKYSIEVNPGDVLPGPDRAKIILDPKPLYAINKGLSLNTTECVNEPIYTKGINTRGFSVIRKVTYSANYFEGTNLTLAPWTDVNCGFTPLRWTQGQDLTSTPVDPINKKLGDVLLNEHKVSELLLETGFQLISIDVQKQEENNEWITYRTKSASNGSKEIKVWEGIGSSDNGIGMHIERYSWIGQNKPLLHAAQLKTGVFRLCFNKELDLDATFANDKNPFVLEDVSSNGKTRKDGKKLVKDYGARFFTGSNRATSNMEIEHTTEGDQLYIYGIYTNDNQEDDQWLQHISEFSLNIMNPKIGTTIKSTEISEVTNEPFTLTNCQYSDERDIARFKGWTANTGFVMHPMEFKNLRDDKGEKNAYMKIRWLNAVLAVKVATTMAALFPSLPTWVAWVAAVTALAVSEIAYNAWYDDPEPEVRIYFATQVADIDFLNEDVNEGLVVDESGNITLKSDAITFPTVGKFSELSIGESFSEQIRVLAVKRLRANGFVVSRIHWIDDNSDKSSTDIVKQLTNIKDASTEEVKKLSKDGKIDDIIDLIPIIAQAIAKYMDNDDRHMANQELALSIDNKLNANFSSYCTKKMPNGEFEHDYSIWGMGENGLYQNRFIMIYNLTTVGEYNATYRTIQFTSKPNVSTKVRIKLGDY